MLKTPHSTHNPWKSARHWACGRQPSLTGLRKVRRANRNPNQSTPGGERYGLLQFRIPNFADPPHLEVMPSFLDRLSISRILWVITDHQLFSRCLTSHAVRRWASSWRRRRKNIAVFHTRYFVFKPNEKGIREGALLDYESSMSFQNRSSHNRLSDRPSGYP